MTSARPDLVDIRKALPVKVITTAVSRFHDKGDSFVGYRTACPCSGHGARPTLSPFCQRKDSWGVHVSAYLRRKRTAVQGTRSCRKGDRFAYACWIIAESHFDFTRRWYWPASVGIGETTDDPNCARGNFYGFESLDGSGVDKTNSVTCFPEVWQRWWDMRKIFKGHSSRSHQPRAQFGPAARSGPIFPFLPFFLPLM